MCCCIFVFDVLFVCDVVCGLCLCVVCELMRVRVWIAIVCLGVVCVCARAYANVCFVCDCLCDDVWFVFVCFCFYVRLCVCVV